MANWNKKLINTAHDGDIEAVKVCLQNGADIDYQDRVRVSALIKAVGGGHLELTRFLLDSGCNPDLTDVGGSTALLTAGWLGWLEVTRLLLDRGCNANLPDKGGQTALHLAAQDGHLQTTRCLVEQGGISPLVKSHEGQTPYDLAAAKKKRQYKEVMEYLQSYLKNFRDSKKLFTAKMFSNTPSTTCQYDQKNRPEESLTLNDIFLYQC